jgi:hypothetical protein
MTIPKLTDDAVSRLPLEAGRAELLEEIMTTVAPDRQTAQPTPPTPSRRGWLVPLAAAAVVAGIAASSLWWRGSPGDAGGESTTSHGAAAQTLLREQGFRAVLDAPGWTVSATEAGDGYGEVNYEKGGAQFTITWYPADSYADYVTDREHIVDPPAPGEPVRLLGASGQLWAYNATDHTVIREVQDGHWMEFRGSGMDDAAYRALLGQLRLVGLADYEAALPDDYVTKAERDDAAAAMLDGITQASGAAWPGPPVAVESTDQDPYQLGAAVAGAYACAWLEEFESATRADDQGRATEAARVLGTARDWPVLNQMNAQGDYPEVVWEYADDVAAGQVPEGYRGGLGCPTLYRS